MQRTLNFFKSKKNNERSTGFETKRTVSKIASSGAAIFWEVAMDGNLANVDGVEGADRKSATETPSPAPAIIKAYTSKCEPIFLP